MQRKRTLTITRPVVFGRTCLPLKTRYQAMHGVWMRTCCPALPMVCLLTTLDPTPAFSAPNVTLAALLTATGQQHSKSDQRPDGRRLYQAVPACCIQEQPPPLSIQIKQKQVRTC